MRIHNHFHGNAVYVKDSSSSSSSLGGARDTRPPPSRGIYAWVTDLIDIGDIYATTDIGSEYTTAG